MRNAILLIALVVTVSLFAQSPRIPASYSNIYYDDNGKLYLQTDSAKCYALDNEVRYSLAKFQGVATGTADGLVLDFGSYEGKVAYGLIPYGQAPHPLPVIRFNKLLKNGKVTINLKRNFRYPYDFVGWSEHGKLTLGYRLISKTGRIMYDGEIAVTGTGPFKVVPTVFAGPFINKLESTSAVVWFQVDKPAEASVSVNGKKYTDPRGKMQHEVLIDGLRPSTKYEYTISCEGLEQTYHFTTAPETGSRKPFMFAYASDSRSAWGGGERMLWGVNAYVAKKMAAVAYSNGASFVQFTGDMVDGYLSNSDEMLLQYVNWKKAVEPFWHYIPFNVTQGNHEALGYRFVNEKGARVAMIDGFPYETFSEEAMMQEAFVNPVNGPVSEDGSKYDPDPNNIDFPSYNETTYYYTYGNVAMVVLNSNYWFAPSMKYNGTTSGGLHAYIMDNQLEWLEKTVKMLEKDDRIDHVFVTQHTPAFPNGGHSGDDMWYSGNNDHRPIIAGKPVDKGIIERRDQYLDILMHKSTKVVAIFTGDEHNYNWLKIVDEMPRYPEAYPHKKLKIKRPIYQINNGASGAPYYAQEKLPWSAHTKSFSIENAVCLIYIDGNKVKMKVINPDTLNTLDELTLME